jgi:hypothetical protein
MAAISGFSYQLVSERKLDSSPGQNELQFKLTYGNGTDTYPTGGIPLSLASLGLRNYCDSLVVSGQDTLAGFLYKFDRDNLKIALYEKGGSGNNNPFAEVLSSGTPQGDIYVIVRGD